MIESYQQPNIDDVAPEKRKRALAVLDALNRIDERANDFIVDFNEREALQADYELVYAFIAEMTCIEDK